MILENKVAVVTGASKGIGANIALTLARNGADVVVNYARDTAGADAVVADIRALGRKAIAVKADVTKPDEVDALLDAAVKEFPKIDILINNAGITKDGFLVLMGDSDWSSVLDTNLTGVFNCCRAFGKHMIGNRSGKIVNVASVSGLIGLAGQANYSAAKAGVIGLTKALSKELAHFKIIVNAVAPGLIETEMIKHIPEKNLKEMIGAIPLKRVGTPDEVSGAVVFLASDAANYITGQVLAITGGL